MNEYVLSLLGAALLAAVIGMLAPGGSSAGVGKTLRLLTLLVLFCVIAAPLPGLIAKLKELPSLSPETTPQFDFEEQAQTALDGASRAYFVRALTTHLEQKFGIAQGEIRCAVTWAESDGETKPDSVTLILSGSAKWKNPHELETYVSDLLGCPCDSAIY